MNSDLYYVLLCGGGSVAVLVAAYLVLRRIPWWATTGFLLLGLSLFGLYQWSLWAKPMPPVEGDYREMHPQAFAIAREKYPHRLHEWEREQRHILLPPTVAMPTTWIGLLGGFSLLVFRWAAWCNEWPTGEEK